MKEKGDPAGDYLQVEAQVQANQRAYENALAQERTLLDKARHDLAGAQATKSKLEQVLPHYVEQEADEVSLTWAVSTRRRCVPSRFRMAGRSKAGTKLPILSFITSIAFCSGSR